jgi:tetratricopeptide (TPR) repeat protein
LTRTLAVITFLLFVVDICDASRGVSPAVREAITRYWLGRSENDPARALSHFEAGKRAAEQARRLSSRDPGALLWWVANEGALAAQARNLGSLISLKQIERVLKRLRDIDPDYAFGGAERALGGIYREAPRFVSIGSLSRAERNLRAAVRRAPEFPGNVLGLAEVLADREKHAEARRLLERARGLLHGPPRDLGEFAPERPSWEKRLAALDLRLGEQARALP